MENKVKPTTQSTPHRMTRRTKYAVLLLAAPTTLIIVTFILFAIINLVLNPTMWPTGDTQSLTPTPVAITIANVMLFFTGTIGVFTWLPSLIAGIVLLATAKK